MHRQQKKKFKNRLKELTRHISKEDKQKTNTTIKILDFINHQRNANQNCNVISLHPS
jgi:hypothetical protein